jgi:hypothetical protein
MKNSESIPFCFLGLLMLKLHLLLVYATLLSECNLKLKLNLKGVLRTVQVRILPSPPDGFKNQIR